MSEDVLVRLFVAIPVPEFARYRLARLQEDLPQLRWTEEKNIHLTLKFIGDVDPQQIKAIKARLRTVRVKPFLLSVFGVGVFPERGNPAVVWAGLGSAHPHLFQLHKQIDDALFAFGIEPDRRVYRPHITLSRCKGIVCDSLRPFLRKFADLETGPFRVQHFQLCSSHLTPQGPEYSCLEEYALLS